MTKETVQQYIDWPELRLPARHSRMKLGIGEIKGFCAGCGEPTVDYRGVAREYRYCLEIEFAGRCWNCKIITFASKFRLYPWGILVRRNGKWVWSHYKRASLFKHILFILKQLKPKARS